MAEAGGGTGRTHEGARKSAVHTGLILIAVVATAAAAWIGKDVLMLGFLAVLIGVVFSFPVGWLSKVMPRGLAVMLTLLVFIGLFVLLGWLAADPLSEQVHALREGAPKALKGAKEWLSKLQGEGGGSGGAEAGAGQGGGAQGGSQAGGAQGGSQAGGQQAGGKAGAPEMAAKVGEKALPALLALVGGATSIVLVIVLGAFLVYQPEVYRKGFRSLIPREHEAVFDEAWRRVAVALRRWVGGILVSMAIMGGLTAAGLAVAGIKEWLLLGVLTFLGTFVPYVGAIASAVPGLLAGLTQDRTHFLYAAGVYLGIHLVEGYVVQPLIQKKANEVQPALLLFGQGLFGAVFGLMGTVVASPLLVCGQVLVDYLWVERRLGKESTSKS